jgi:hypothetical protein
VQQQSSGSSSCSLKKITTATAGTVYLFLAMKNVHPLNLLKVLSTGCYSHFGRVKKFMIGDKKIFPEIFYPPSTLQRPPQAKGVPANNRNALKRKVVNLIKIKESRKQRQAEKVTRAPLKN